MPNVIVSMEAQNFIATTHQFGRLLPQVLREQLPEADTVTIHYEPINVGGYEFMAVTFFIERAGCEAITVIIDQNDMLSRHPDTKDPLFRAENLIRGVIRPKIKSLWPPREEN